MGKRKMHRESHNIMEKIKKLERKLAKRRRRISSSSSSLYQAEDSFIMANDMEPVAGPSGLAESYREEVPLTVDDAIPTGDDESPPEEDLTLNEGILEILGSDPTQEKIFGENLHKDIVPRWNHILSNGLSKENKDGLLKTYLPPENCANMKSPKLNPEVRAALTELNVKKDNFSQGKQNQISGCLAALGIALNLALSQPDSSQDLIKSLSEVSKLLCDLQFVESKSRRYCIVNTLNKEMRESLKNTKIDEFLFGSELTEHIKSTKAITKSGSELRYSRTKTPTGARTLNAMGAQRAPVAQPRTNPYYGAGARRPPPPPPPPPQRSAPPPPPPRDRRTQHSTWSNARPYHHNAQSQQRAPRGRRH